MERICNLPVLAWASAFFALPSESDGQNNGGDQPDDSEGPSARTHFRLDFTVRLFGKPICILWQIGHVSFGYLAVGRAPIVTLPAKRHGETCPKTVVIGSGISRDAYLDGRLGDVQHDGAMKLIPPTENHAVIGWAIFSALIIAVAHQQKSLQRTLKRVLNIGRTFLFKVLNKFYWLR